MRGIALVATLMVLAAGCPTRTSDEGIEVAPLDAGDDLVTAEEVQEHLAAAQEAFDAEDYPKAAQEAAAGLEGDPHDARLLRIHGMASLHLGKPAEAIPSLEAAAVAEPRDPDIQQALAEAYDATGEPEAAAPHAGLAAELYADDPWAHFAHGLLLKEIGEYAEAAKALGQADALMPDDPEILLTMAEAYCEAGDPEACAVNARAALDAMVVSTSESEPPHYPDDRLESAARANELLAMSHLARATPDEESADREVARQYLEEIPLLIEDEDLARAHQMRAYQQAGYVESAVWTLGQMEAVPERPWAQMVAARTYLDAGESFDEALQAAEKAVELGGETAETLSLRGWANFKNENYETAEKDLLAALELARTSRREGELHYRLAKTYEALGSSAQAGEHQEKADQLGYGE
jgi:tetratricopeptide (TPR) repeat protein